MLRTKRLVAVFSYQFSLKKRLSSQELPVSGEALIASLWTLPTLQQTFEVLEDKAVELQPIRRRTFQVLYQRLSTDHGFSAGSQLIEAKRLAELLNQFRKWCEDPWDAVQLYELLAELRHKRLFRLKSEQSEELSKHISELKEHIKEQLMSPSCHDAALLARFICTSASESSYSYEVFQKLKQLPGSIPKQSVVSLLGAFSKLAPPQQRFVYSYCYRLCSLLKVQTLSNLERAYTYKFLCQLDLEKNSPYKRQVRLLSELADAVVETRTLREVELMNYLEGSAARSDDEHRLTISVDTTRDYSISFCIRVLTAKNVDLRISADQIQRFQTAVWNEFVSKDEELRGAMLHTYLEIFGKKAVNEFKKKLLKLSYIKRSSLQLLISTDKLTEMREVFQASLEKQLNRPNESASFGSLEIIELYDLYHCHIREHPHQRLSVDIEQKVQEYITTKLAEYTGRKFEAKKILKAYFEETNPPHNNEFLKLVEEKMVALFHTLIFKRFDRLHIQLSIGSPERLGLLGDLEGSDINYIKTIYASLKKYSPQLFELLWKQIFCKESTSNQIFFVLSTDSQVAQEPVLAKMIDTQSILNPDVDLLKENISVRSLVLLYRYSECPLVNKYDILEAVERNIQSGILSKLPIESAIELLKFYLSKSSKENRALPKGIVELLRTALETIVLSKSIEQPIRAWFSKVVLILVLNSHLHSQLHPLSVAARTTIEGKMRQYALQALATQQQTSNQIRVVLLLLELFEIGYSLEYNDQLLETLMRYQGQPVAYSCCYRDNLPKLFQKLRGSNIQLL